MKTSSPIFQLLTLSAALLVVAGCQTRSISDSGYRKESSWHGYHGNRFYTGELSEFHVLGVEPDAKVTDAEIGKALDDAGKIKLRKGANVMVIQSGAMVPDAPVVVELNKYFTVTPFSGQPVAPRDPYSPRRETNAVSYSKGLRLAAAKAACESIVCYWGTLETAQRQHGTKILSWVPIVGGVVPDETQQMRIRLKVAVIDVRSGNWSVFTPEMYENKALSGKLDRASSDQTQVEKLKNLAYQAAVNDLIKRYAN